MNLQDKVERYLEMGASPNSIVKALRKNYDKRDIERALKGEKRS